MSVCTKYIYFNSELVQMHSAFHICSSCRAEKMETLSLCVLRYMDYTINRHNNDNNEEAKELEDDFLFQSQMRS